MSFAAATETAALIGDTSRALMLYALRDEAPLSSGALARIGGVAPSTASEHLARMVEAGIIGVEKKGRQRFYRLAMPEVVDLLDGLEVVAGRLQNAHPERFRLDETHVHVHACYDHLAGWVGVRMTMDLFEKGRLVHGPEGPQLSAEGRSFLTGFGLNLERLETSPRTFLRMCHDWQLRTVHLGGMVASGIMDEFLARDWVRRGQGAEKVRIMPKGRAGLRETFGIDMRAAAGTGSA